MLILSVTLFVLLVMILLFYVLTSIPYAIALSMSLLMRSLSSPLLLPIRSMSLTDRRWHIWVFNQWTWMCGGHGVFPAWSSLGISWTGWVRVSIHYGHLLLSWRTPLTDCSKECIVGVLILCLNGLNQSLLYHAEASEDLPQACMLVSVKCLLTVYEVVEQIALVL